MIFLLLLLLEFYVSTSYIFFFMTCQFSVLELKKIKMGSETKNSKVTGVFRVFRHTGLYLKAHT